MLVLAWLGAEEARGIEFHEPMVETARAYNRRWAIATTFSAAYTISKLLVYAQIRMKTAQIRKETNQRAVRSRARAADSMLLMP